MLWKSLTGKLDFIMRVQSFGRILIVEDEPLIAEMLMDWVLELGCELAGPVASNDAGLALLAEGNVRAAILDITVTDGHTYPIAKQLQKLGVPFAFATGHGSESIDPKFRDVPILQKPFDFDAFASVIASLARSHSHNL